MSWEQTYHIERLIDFAQRLSKKDYALFIREVFEKIVGKKVAKIEQVVLDDDFYSGKQTGSKITFEDGDTYIHKLVERYTSRGNYGCDSYHLIREDEKIKVREINED